jgi:hypothetical protein
MSTPRHIRAARLQGCDYYGRILGLPPDHTDKDEGIEADEDFDDGDLTRCECVTGCELSDEDVAAMDDVLDYVEYEPFADERTAAAAEDRWIAERDRTASQ